MAQGAHEFREPREIHHVWVGSPFNPTPAERRNLEAWKTHFPGAVQKIWTDADAARLLPNYPEIAAVYDDLKPIQKADILRYLVLHARGGVYADLDYELFRPFAVDHTRVMIVGSRIEDSMNNCLLTSPAPGHPFWKRVIDAIPDKLANNKWKHVNHELYVIQSTGPSLVNAIYRKDSSGVGILPWQQFNPCDDVCPNNCGLPRGVELYGRHVSAFSWGSTFKTRVRAALCALIRYRFVVVVVIVVLVVLVVAALVFRRRKYQLPRALIRLGAKLKTLRRR
jgi:mannosyltransferase OCH1-like enzyme